MMIKKESGRVLVCTATLLTVIIAVGASLRLSSARPPQDSHSSMYEQVLAAVRKQAPNYWSKPSAPSLLISCLDFRINGLVNELCSEYKQMYPLRVPGGHVASCNEKFNTGSGTVGMFAGRAGAVIHIAHGDCKFYAAVRQRISSEERGTDHFAQMVDEVPEIADSDMEQGLRNIRSILTNPVLAARIEKGEAEFIGLFLSADGSVYIYDAKQNKYKLIQRA